MRADDVQSTEPVRHGAYLCLTVPGAARAAVAEADVPGLAERLGLVNEFDNADPPLSIAYLRRVGAFPRDIADEGLAGADVIVHVAAPTGDPVAAFCASLARMLGPELGLRVLGGVVRPMMYTSLTTFNFSYGHRVLQGPGAEMPHVFLVPLRKSAQWWGKDWMERHTYFLPRYRENGMDAEGHTFAARAGIDHLMRRTYRSPVEPAVGGEYDFVSYFECADEGVPVFHETCDALRDVGRNPEWAYVSEGPTWQGVRVAGWAELFVARGVVA